MNLVVARSCKISAKSVFKYIHVASIYSQQIIHICLISSLTYERYPSLVGRLNLLLDIGSGLS